MSTAHHPPQLAIDIGNTVVKAAVLGEGGKLGPVIRFNDQEWSAADELVTNHGVKNIVYSTVANVPPPTWMDKWTTEGRFVLALTSDVPLPFRSEYGTMNTLGQDRIAAVAGSLVPTDSAPAAVPTASLIVDAGTCATLDLIDASGTYHGGNISPGLRMRLQAMHAFTARLPKLEPAKVTGRVGQSTAAALRHGAQLGLVYEIEGLYRRLQADFPGLQLLLTGGDAPWLAEHLSVPHVFRPYLVLRGLHLILSNYVNNES
ncbi:MAG: type III pantothenate kinase [Bacteroidota bacterium]